MDVVKYQQKGCHERMGSASVDQLLLDGTPISEQPKLVDRFLASTGNHATIFVREGNDFVRVMTSLKRQNGNRTIGTFQRRSHPGYQDLLNGREFSNKVALFD